jgi:hypothetical protein
MNRHTLAFVLFLITIALGSLLAHSATITWVNTAGGNWSDAANWSPNQVPTNTDTALITTPGTYTVNLDVPGVVTNLTLGAGGGAAGEQTLVASNMLTVYSLALVTGGGMLNSSGNNAGFSGAMTIANGGVLNLAAGYDNFTFTANPLIATNGGVVNAGGSPIDGGYGGTEYYFGSTINGTVGVASGGVLNSLGASFAAGLTVAQGGEVNVNSLGMVIKEPLTNSGTINLTDGQLGNYNYDYVSGSANGELVNLPGGLINLQGSTVIGGGGIVVNQGVIVQSAGTNTISTPGMDKGLGTVTNLSGVMTLSLFQTNLTGTYFAAAGATIQFVGADIANANSAAQLTLGTPLVLAGGGQYQLTSGYLYLPANVPTNLELLGDTVELGSNFQGGAITNLSVAGMQMLNGLPVTGTLTATNSGIATNVVVAGGGVFSYEGTGFLAGTVTVESGGIFNVINPGGNMYDDIRLNQGATVAHGGTMNCEGYFTITTLTNAGTLNLASQLVLYTATNGIVNQPGGLINLESNAVITIAATNDYFINQGAIVQNAGAGATNSISYLYPYQPFQFDNSQGTITNLSGTLVLPSFQSTLAGTFYAAAGATIQLGGGTIGAPLVPGTPLVLGGSGQYQFISGYLYLAVNTIPNLSLQGGQLTLGAGFQGGAITNLILDGITFSNQSPTTLPINGTFTIINSGYSGSINSSLWAGLYGNGVSGNYTVAGGDVLNMSNAVMYGGVAVTNGGVLNGNGTIYGAVTVANGGVFNSSSTLYGNLTVANGGLFNGSAFMYGAGSVTVASGGVMNLGDLFLFGPLTNSGTINITNARSSISMYNSGMPGAQGGVINQAGGLIDFVSDQTGIGGNSGGYEYLINQGRIIKSAGSGLSGIGPAFATNSGAITAQTGQILMAGQWTLLSPGSLNVVLSSATNYGSFIISTNYPNIVGTADLAGAFNATLNNGYFPTNGTTFNVVTYGSFTGSFSSLGLPAAVSWQSNYGSTNFSLVAGSELPQFGIVNLSGTNLIFNGTGGPAGSNYVMLASTNLALPLTNWTALATNTFDGSGRFYYTNPVSPAKPRQFFIFKLP